VSPEDWHVTVTESMQRCVARRITFNWNWKYAGVCRCGQAHFLPTLTVMAYYFRDFGLDAADGCLLATRNFEPPMSRPWRATTPCRDPKMILLVA
jgi:hypothetical protein